MRPDSVEILYLEPAKAPRRMTITNNLRTYQALVMGSIEVLGVDGFRFVVNEESTYRHEEGDPAFGPCVGVPQVLFGPVVVTKVDNEGDFVGLNEIEICMVLSRLVSSQKATS